MNKNLKRGRVNRVVFLIILIVIAIIAITGLLNNKGNNSNLNSSNVETYGDKEIKALLIKGFDNMKNFYVEEFSAQTNKLNKNITIKDNIRKIITKGTEGYLLIDLNLEKKVVVNTNKKIAVKMKIAETESINDLKYSPFITESELSANVKYECLKKEQYKNKECIVVKQIYNNNSNKTLTQNTYRVFWIEEKTGYIIGIGEIYNTKDEIMENVYYDNIKINELKDSDFDIPKDYKIIEN